METTSAPDQPKRPATKRVAVIAIHGVADQAPSSTASRIANLLLRHLPQSYTGFVQTDVRVGVQRMHMEAESDANDDPDFQEAERKRPSDLLQINPRSKFIKRARRKAVKKSAAGPTAPGVAVEQAPAAGQPPDPLANMDHNYMREQLESYEPDGADSVYETVRLTGNRLSDIRNGAPRCEVHIYESYWADISRASTGFRRLVMELYLLLFYLCGMGRHSIEFAQIAYAKAKQVFWWKWFGRFQLFAEGLLTLGLPILNLCLAGLALTTLPVRLTNQKLVLAIAIGALVAAATGLTLYLRRYKWFTPKRWFLSAVFWGIGSALLSWGALSVLRPWNPIALLAVVGWGVAALIILGVMAAYQKRKRGAFPFALAAVAATTLVFLLNPHFREGVTSDFAAMTPKGPEAALKMSDATMFSAEVLFAALCLCWVLFSLCYVAVCVTGHFAVQSVDKKDRPEARQVRWTVHLTLVLPGVLVAIANVLLWQALLLVLGRFIRDDVYEPVILDRWLLSAQLAKFAQSLLELTAGPYMAVAYLLPLLAGIIVVWALLPVLLTEIKVPKPEPKQTEWLGKCLDRGFHVARWLGLALAAAILLTPAAYALTWWDPHYLQWPEVIRNRPGRVLASAGSGLLLIVLGSKLPFKAAFKTLRSVIDIALDVANWLRVYPKRANPKARICARFTSLLRHVRRWKDPDDGSSYAGIVIIAHSQGTVIAAETLRFLQREPDPTLNGNGHIYLFTMGSPLRQLYSLRFPHHYRWARCNGNEAKGTELPDPSTLGVKKWVNAFRSADYVGRYLWQDESSEERWNNAPRESAGRRERCIGGGAHNRYWDETAPDIARELDLLVKEAAEC